METWLSRGAALHHKMQRDPRVASRSPAKAWGRGLVGEGRGPDSPGLSSPGLVEQSKGLRKDESIGDAEKRRAEQIQRDHEFAMALEASEREANSHQQGQYLGDHGTRQILTDREIAIAEDARERELYRPQALDPEVARAVAAENTNKPRFSPTEENKRFWSNEPGEIIRGDPEQLTCNLCTNNKKNYRTFEVLQSHKIQKHIYCAVCDSDFIDEDTLYEHKTNTPDHWFCRFCALDFQNREAFLQHKKQGKWNTLLEAVVYNRPFSRAAIFDFLQLSVLA